MCIRDRSNVSGEGEVVQSNSQETRESDKTSTDKGVAAVQLTGACNCGGGAAVDDESRNCATAALIRTD